MCRIKYTSLFTLVLLFVTSLALASVTLSWDYTQNPDAPSTRFIVQRCQIAPTVTTCDDMIYLPDGMNIPIYTLTFTDATTVDNTFYCYQVLATNDVDLSITSNTVCLDVPQVRAVFSTRTHHFFGVK